MRPAPVEIELGYRAYWLVRLRWIAASSAIWGTFAATAITGLPLDPVPLYLIGAAIALYNSLFLIALRWSETDAADRRLRTARLLTNGQIVVDLAALTLLVHFTGGVETPLPFFFVFHVITASILLSRREAFQQATLACLLYGGLLVAELIGAVPHVHVLGPAGYHPARDGQFVLISLLAFASTLYLSAYLATSIVIQLRRRERENLDLTARIEEKAVELESAYRNLSELAAIKSRDLSEVSRQVRVPLAWMQGTLRGLLDGGTGHLTAPQRESVARVESRIEGLLALASDLLVLSRASDARAFRERKPVDLSAVAATALAGQSKSAEESNVRLTLEECPSGAMVLGEREALGQMVSHLTSNAIGYTLAGGRVDVSVQCLGDVVRLRITDTGIGIPSADIPRIFDEFFRAENARRFREGGAGLGLSIARGVAERHGGRIEVESELGAGTTVTVLLPASREGPAAGSAEQERAPMQG
ncbi:MAG TPA: HAMP domain-containing sensor histidine kinase [Chloroflexota bacterium]